MTDDERQAWELEHGKVWLGDAYQTLLVNLNLTPIFEVDNAKHGYDSWSSEETPE